ncbi:MAG TPA: glutathione peroxidase [Nocardioidaceae bacterium]|nr:glutathione peroxidase [Nocardioidaceae bacterium]
MTLLDTPIALLDGTPSTLGEITGGRVALIVNVASQCGFTPQYAGLEALQQKYGDQGFTVVGVPCNQFGAQEPGTSDQIAEFCETSFGVSFPMTEKLEVNGPGRHPIYDVLTLATTASGKTGDVRWNFEKYLVDSDGNVAARFSHPVPPEDPRLIDALEELL